MSDKIEQLEPKLEKKLGFRNMHEKLEKNFCLMLVLFFFIDSLQNPKGYFDQGILNVSF